MVMQDLLIARLLEILPGDEEDADYTISSNSETVVYRSSIMCPEFLV